MVVRSRALPRALRAVVLLLGVGCGGSDNSVVVQRRALQTELLTFDVGTVAVGSSETFVVYLSSVGSSDVTLYDIQVEDQADTFVVVDDWKVNDADGDGLMDSQVVSKGSDEDPEYVRIEVDFRPQAEGYFRTTLVVASDDNEVTEHNDEGHGLWKVTLRGVGRYPCARVWPAFLDFGLGAAGGSFFGSATVQNCGAVTLTATTFALAGDPSFYVDTPSPLYVLPSGSEPIEIGWQPEFGPADDQPEGVTLSILTDDPNNVPQVEVVGNDCNASVADVWDADGDGWSFCGGDCDDTDADIHPGAAELATGGVDEDCDDLTDEAATDNDSDADGDGYTYWEGDCSNDDPDVNPAATEIINHIDDNCDDIIDNQTERYDDDGDGLSEQAGDCDDDDDDVHPGAVESINNEVDDDCDDMIDEGGLLYDDDGDGFVDIAVDGNEDCNDLDPWSWPGADEDCDDRDNDCDGLIDEGAADEPDGACAFVVARKAVTADTGGCAATTAPPGVLLAAAAGALLVARRRRRPA
jgi:Putative metal-binding motif